MLRELQNLNIEHVHWLLEGLLWCLCIDILFQHVGGNTLYFPSKGLWRGNKEKGAFAALLKDTVFYHWFPLFLNHHPIPMCVYMHISKNYPSFTHSLYSQLLIIYENISDIHYQQISHITAWSLFDTAHGHFVLHPMSTTACQDQVITQMFMSSNPR